MIHVTRAAAAHLHIHVETVRIARFCQQCSCLIRIVSEQFLHSLRHLLEGLEIVTKARDAADRP